MSSALDTSTRRRKVALRVLLGLAGLNLVTGLLGRGVRQVRHAAHRSVVL
jgi:hypothetical protein